MVVEFGNEIGCKTAKNNAACGRGAGKNQKTTLMDNTG
jgi:hypothetical protein